MAGSTSPRVKSGPAIAILAGFLALLAVGLLTFNVTRELRLLASARSDSVQWSLAQTEVEFLEFSSRLAPETIDLAELRRRFDVFYSRIDTVQRANLFADLREDRDFLGELESVSSFLDESVTIIDASDDELLRRIPELSANAQALRSHLRAMASSGVVMIAKSEEKRRSNLARTMTELALAVATLIGILALTVYFLNKLNRTVTRREKIQNRTATRMNTIIGTSLDGVIVSDAEGRILEFSPAAEVIFGHAAHDVRGKLIGDIIVPEHLRQLHRTGMDRIQHAGERHVVGKGRLKLEAQRASGDIFPVELAIQSAVTDEGEIFIAFLRDISKQVADEEELVQARDRALAGEKLKSDFLVTLSHEIRTPLNGLLGNLELLRETRLSLKQTRNVRNMETSGRLLMSHISDVLDIARFDAGKLSIRNEPMNVSSLLQDIVDSQSGTALSNETTLTWSWRGPAMNWVNSDRDRLQHVLMNLVGNAVKFTKRGTVSLTVGAKNVEGADVLIFEITDTGPGVPDDLVSQIFDDFVTGNTAYDREVGGTGLGLGIAKRFVSAMNGEIGVSSVVGTGSTFWVKLPVSQATPPSVNTTETESSKSPERLKVLLIEDNEINRVVAIEMLESEGHQVAIAEDGQQGLQMAENDAFDVILMDISMPMMDGRAATRAIRRGNGPSSSAPIIALTANSMAEEQKSFFADGMNGVVTKPMSKEALRKVLHRNHKSAEPVHIEGKIDQVHLAETRDALGAKEFKNLLARFVSEVDELIDWLHSTETAEPSDIATRAHKIAGSASVFGAVEMFEHLKEIENAAKAADRTTIVQLAAQLPELWSRSRSALN